MSTLTLTNAVVDNIIKNDATTATDDQLDSTEVNACIAKAVEEYSHDQPYVKLDMRIGNSEHELALPSDWVDGFSDILTIEYPAGSQEPSYIDENNYEVVKEDTTHKTISTGTLGATTITLATVADAGYFKDGEIVTIGDDDATMTNWITADGNTTTGVVSIKTALAAIYDSTPYVCKKDHIRLLADEPLSSEILLIEYKLSHTLSDSSDTTYEADYYALCYLAAAYCCESLAALFSFKQESSIAADSVNFGGKADEWTTRADKFRKIYNNHIGKGKDQETKAIGKKVDIDAVYHWGRSFLFHGGRFR